MSSLPRLCARCQGRLATNGDVCLHCAQSHHCWDGDALRATCRVCGTVRYKRRKRTRRPDTGSRWQTWYDIDPDTDEKPNPIPRCR